MTAAMREILLNGKWPMILPEHRAARPQWTNPPYWEPERMDALEATISPGDVVYDIGAEEGEMTGCFASWGAQVCAAEPNPRVWANIRAIWEANELPRLAGWWVGFAGDKTDESCSPEIEAARVDVGGWPACAYGPVIGDHGFCVLNERPDIPRVRLDYACSTLKWPVPDVVTMDVEGAELRVLQGARWILSQHRPIIFVSVHPQFMADTFGDKAQDLFDYMDRAGYDATFLATDHEDHWMWRPRNGPQR